MLHPPLYLVLSHFKDIFLFVCEIEIILCQIFILYVYVYKFIEVREFYRVKRNKTYEMFCCTILRLKYYNEREYLFNHTHIKIRLLVLPISINTMIETWYVVVLYTRNICGFNYK